MSKEIIWSKDEDIWDHAPEDKSEVLQEIYDSCEEGLQVGTVIYYGERVQPSNLFVNAYDIIELIEERAYDIGGEYVDNYPDCSPEQRKELEDFLIKWQEQFKPTWFNVVNVKEYVVTEEDLKEVIVYD